MMRRGSLCIFVDLYLLFRRKRIARAAIHIGYNAPCASISDVYKRQVEAMEYLQNDFDGYYYKRELNKNLSQVKMLKSWCDANGKKLYMLANSGCLNFCSARQFHDNLVAHEREIAAMDNGVQFHSACSQFLSLSLIHIYQ